MNAECTVDQLKKQFKPEELGIKSTKNLEKLKGIVGQKRASDALHFGLQIDGLGYNIYVSGPPGIGKMTSVKSYLKELASNKEIPSDWIYVNNFADPYEPKVIELSAGRGCELKVDMDNLIEHVKSDLPKAFESDEYSSQREEVTRSHKKRREDISRELNEKAREKGFSMQSTPMGVVLYPVRDGKPLEEKDMESLPEEEKKKIQQTRGELEQELNEAMKKARKIERDIQEEIKELDKKVALNIVGGIIDDIKEKYQDYKRVQKYLDDVKNNILENIATFKTNPQQQQQGGGAQALLQGKVQIQAMQQQVFNQYKVNVLIDNRKIKGAPVIEELNPTFNNIVGRIEKEMQYGALTTDFSMIKAGALLRANGGFLVIPIESLLRNYYSYEALKRALRSSQLRIEELSETLGYMSVKTIRPEPIPLKVKVVLVGSPIYYYLLQKYDEDFPELFKVKADFDTRMDAHKDNVSEYISFISTYCEREHLSHFDSKAVAQVLEYATRLADDQEKLSMKFGQLSDIIREANYWAGQDNGKLVTDKHVRKALDEKIFRSNMIEKNIQEMIANGTILINMDQNVIAQVNGLSVINLGDYMFGRPNRITATVRPGREGVVDIEREAKLGGPIHSKGVLILSGYLGHKYAIGRPLTLSSRIVFEQSYSGVEGDSASSTELYAIISALAEVPIKQGIAVTGSVNQHGQIQAIGGINNKIEGFFDICRIAGLTGKQGVLIPKSNLRNLMLKDEVIDAVEKGDFHIWAAETIDQGIEILTGMSAGADQGDGTFTKDSINERVRLKLIEYEETMRSFGEAGAQKEKNE